MNESNEFAQTKAWLDAWLKGYETARSAAKALGVDIEDSSKWNLYRKKQLLDDR